MRGPGCVASVEEPVVEAEERDDGLVGVERGSQGGVVVQAQVAPKPDDCGHRTGYG